MTKLAGITAAVLIFGFSDSSATAQEKANGDDRRL